MEKFTEHEWKILNYYKKLNEERHARTHCTEVSIAEVADTLNSFAYISTDGTRRYDIPEELLLEITAIIDRAKHAYDYYDNTICKTKMPIRTRFAFKTLYIAEAMQEKLLKLWHCPHYFDNRKKDG